MSNEDEQTALDPKDPLQDVFENKNLLFQLTIIGGMLKLAQMKDGMKTIQVLGKETIHGLFNMLDSAAQASSANYVAAWAMPMLISGVLERFGMLPPAFNRGFHDGISKIEGVDLATGIIETLFGKEAPFPQALTFAKEAGVAKLAGTAAAAALPV